MVSPYSPSGLVTKPAAKPPPSQDSPKPYLNSLHFSSRFLLRLGSLLGSSWLPLGLHLGPLLGSILAQLRPKSPLDTLLFQKSRFSKKRAPLGPQHDFDPKMGPKIGPRWSQDGFKTILEGVCFRLRFCLRFWSVLSSILSYFGSNMGPILAPFWNISPPHRRALLGPKRHKATQGAPR